MNVNAYVGRTGLLVIKTETTFFEVTSLDKTNKLELNVHLLRNTKTNKIELNVYLLRNINASFLMAI